MFFYLLLSTSLFLYLSHLIPISSICFSLLKSSYIHLYTTSFIFLYLTISYSIYLSISSCIFLYLSICLSIYLSIHLSIYLFIFLLLSSSLMHAIKESDKLLRMSDCILRSLSITETYYTAVLNCLLYFLSIYIVIEHAGRASRYVRVHYTVSCHLHYCSVWGTHGSYDEQDGNETAAGEPHQRCAAQFRQSRQHRYRHRVSLRGIQLTDAVR